jgi:DNA modification methylase
VNLGTATVIRGDARNLPLPDDSVDLIVTSPPYFALRSYQDGGQHYAGQIGDEPTPAEFVRSLLEVTRECVRVLKPSGSLWVNLGDKYAQNVERSRNGFNGALTSGNVLPSPVYSGRRDNGVRSKSLLGIPWRYALRCIDDLGLILRAEVIWSKPNGLPESVTDRVRRSHEQWFHFTREPRYFSAVDGVREAHTWGRRISPAWSESRKEWGQGSQGRPQKNDGFASLNPLGKLPGSVRTVPTEPLRVPDHFGVDHFAAFPTAWPKWIIQGWAPTRGVCEACGEGRRPSTATTHSATRRDHSASWIVGSAHHRTGSTEQGGERPIGAMTTITHYACACPDTTAPTRPAVILDPFGGTGTTALVANALGCHGISVDMSADYCRLAEWRTNDPGQLAKVLDVEKPPEVAANQTDLFDLIGGDAA